MKTARLLIQISTFTGKICKWCSGLVKTGRRGGNCLVKHIKHMDLHVPLLSFTAKGCS